MRHELSKLYEIENIVDCATLSAMAALGTQGKPLGRGAPANGLPRERRRELAASCGREPGGRVGRYSCEHTAGDRPRRKGGAVMISDINIKINRDLCFTCGRCVERCIMDNLRMYLAPCRSACPIHMNCQGYVRLTRPGQERRGGPRDAREPAFCGAFSAGSALIPAKTNANASRGRRGGAYPRHETLSGRHTPRNRP